MEKIELLHICPVPQKEPTFVTKHSEACTDFFVMPVVRNQKKVRWNAYVCQTRGDNRHKALHVQAQIKCNYNKESTAMERHNRFRPEWIATNNSEVRRLVRLLLRFLMVSGLTIPFSHNEHDHSHNPRLGQVFFRKGARNFRYRFLK